MERHAGPFPATVGGTVARGYRPWPLRRAIASRRAGEPIPPRTFVVTFDDGYGSVYHNAWPILKELSVPATVFVVTAYLDADRPFPFDDWAAAGSAGVPAASLEAALHRPMRTRWCEQGLIELGSHTHTHVDFRGRPEVFRGDLARSLDVLKGVFGTEHAAFAFPFGHFATDLIAAARSCGVACALTAEKEPVLPHADPFGWGRFDVDGGDTAATVGVETQRLVYDAAGAWHWLDRPHKAGQVPMDRRTGCPLPTEDRAAAPGKMVSL